MRLSVKKKHLKWPSISYEHTWATASLKFCRRNFIGWNYPRINDWSSSNQEEERKIIIIRLKNGFKWTEWYCTFSWNTSSTWWNTSGWLCSILWTSFATKNSSLRIISHDFSSSSKWKSFSNVIEQSISFARINVIHRWKKKKQQQQQPVLLLQQQHEIHHRILSILKMFFFLR